MKHFERNISFPKDCDEGTYFLFLYSLPSLLSARYYKIAYQYITYSLPLLSFLASHFLKLKNKTIDVTKTERLFTKITALFLSEAYTHTLTCVSACKHTHTRTRVVC